eukprot:CFRG0240T1
MVTATEEKHVDVLGSDEIETLLSNVLIDPTVFISPNPSISTQLLDVTKKLFDLAVTESVSNARSDTPNMQAGPLDCLLTEGFDHEMLWEELQLQNVPMTNYIKKGTEKTISISNSQGILLIANESDSESEEEDNSADYNALDGNVPDVMNESEAENSEEASENDEEESEDDDDGEEMARKMRGASMDGGRGQQKTQSKRGRRSAVDDDFFKLADMNNFLDDMDRLEDKKNSGKGDENESEEEMDGEEDDEEGNYDGDVDLFTAYSDAEGEESDEEGTRADEGEEKEGINYEDFFDAPTSAENFTATRKTGNKAKLDTESTEKSESESENEISMADENDEQDINSDAIMEDSESESEERGMKRNLLSDDEDEEEVPMTEFEKKQAKLRQRIKEIEEANLQSKSWQMSGESTAKTRETNSLLQEVLDFETTMKPAPEITQEVTQSLEDMIKQRIKDDAWDDVERKEALPTHTTRRANYELDMEKSKKGLADVYEEEYMKQVGGAPDAEAIKTKAEQDKVTEEFMQLCAKLDALANFHYTPARAKEDVAIIVNKSALAMEEVLPTAVSTVQQLAPEEAYRKSRQELKGDDEKTESDRARERKAKKADKRQKNKETDERRKKLEKTNPALAHKLSKKVTMNQIKKGKMVGASAVGSGADTRALKSSTAFFSKLQDEARQTIKGSSLVQGEKVEKKNNESARLKL